jgi:sulfoxide reductase heme-binding subunit YedZ
MTGRPIWYLDRATGIVSLVLMTAVVVLGVVVQRQGQLPGLPRFGTVLLHRSVALLSALLIAVHVGTAVLDNYVPIGAWAAFLPFTSGWRPAAVGMGTLAVDLLVLIIATSLLRGRIPLGLWRAVHRTSYLLWPLAFLHGLTAGTDLKSGWALALALLCAAVVGGAAAVAWAGRSTHPPDRAPRAVAQSAAALARGRRPAVFRNR